MTRVLLACPEPLGHGQPAGIGIRFVEIANVLKADGHEVVTLSPDSGLTPENLLRYSEQSDVAVVQGHVANDLFAHAKPIPTVVDLYDPFIIENLHYFDERGAEVFTHDHATLVNSLLHGDFFLCASEAQRMFYVGLLLAVGRVNPIAFAEDPNLDALIRIAPFGVQPPRAAVPRNEPAVLFGGIYDWYDPIAAIEAVALARERVPAMTLTFTRHPNPDITPQGKAAEAMEHVRAKRYDFVRFEPWVPYDRRGEFFERFALALLTFPRSIETDLAMRTRVYDYMWGGLPIVTSSAPGTDEILVKYGAGRIARPVCRRGGLQPPESPARAAAGRPYDNLSDDLVSVFHDRDSYAAGAQRFAREHQWSDTLAPLREFCRAPRVDRSKEAFAIRAELPPLSILDRIRRRMKALT